MTVAETLALAKNCLANNESDFLLKEEFICHAINHSVGAGTPEAIAAVDFLESYGMEVGGSWFCRDSDNLRCYDDVVVLRQERRHAFLSVAIKHATELGI